MKNNFGGVGKGYEDSRCDSDWCIRGAHMQGGVEARADDPVRPRGGVCDGPD
jgi:hypothetical protein